MTEEIVREIINAVPEYVGIDEITDDYENLRVTNLMIDSLNNKKATFIEIMVSDAAERIPNMPEYGSFLICVQGAESTMPSSIYACCSNGTAGTVASLVAQAGSDDWNANTVTIASSGADFTIVHDRAGVDDKFYLTILGYF